MAKDRYLLLQPAAFCLVVIVGDLYAFWCICVLLRRSVILVLIFIAVLIYISFIGRS